MGALYFEHKLECFVSHSKLSIAELEGKLCKVGHAGDTFSVNRYRSGELTTISTMLRKANVQHVIFVLYIYMYI